MTAVTCREHHEVLASVVYGLSHQIAELVQTVGLADQSETVRLGLHLAGRGTLDQFIQ